MSSHSASIPGPRVSGRYTILNALGTGGSGTVHRAVDEVTGKVVAFKQLLLAKTGKRQKTMGALFEREYHTLVRLKHPRIIEVYDYGHTPEGPYYTMELLEGSDLSQLRQLPYVDVCRHLRDVASSLALLHAQRLVHRDVSPRNIRITADGTARLLDFGALASFGTNTEVIGTAPFMAPEILQQTPLDPRTDLYSLGAVGYFCLTGRHAYATRDVSELPRLWQTPPAPPSTFAPDVPPELDSLILSMISQDPLGRPETAAAVIDQLTVIGHLAPETHEPAEQSYFVSSPMVGRAVQLDWVFRRIDGALGGTGGEVVVEGPPGIGKTRLVNELCLAGTLKGAVSLKVDAESSRSTFGVAAALGRRLLEACPEIAHRKAEPHASLLRKLSPDLADALGGADSATLASDPTERRIRFHAALRDWFLAVSQERTLLLCLDNLHAADDESASFLATLGRDSRSAHLFVLTTLRAGSAVTAPEAVRGIRDRSQRLRLSALDHTACEQLANGLFGGAENAGRVGSLLFARSGGVPRQFIELARLMVQKKIAKYEAGSWVLPLDVAEDELPVRSDEVLAARVSELGPDAVALAEVLAVHTGAVPLALVLAVSEVPAEGKVYRALDALLAEQVLRSEGDGYRFRDEPMRDAVLSRMSPEARRRCQLRFAEALLGSEASGGAERVEAALHLIDAGEEDRGARILVSAARDFAAGAGMHQNLDQLVRALCRVVRAFDAGGRSDHELAPFLFPLIRLAYYSANWEFVLEYGEHAVDMGMRMTGLRRAAELEAELGREEAMKRGFGAAAPGFAAGAASGVAYDLKTAIAATIGVVPACAGVAGSFLDTERMSRIAAAVEPLTLFGEQHVAHAIYLFAKADALTIEGREAESRPLWERALARYEDPAVVQALGEGPAKALQGGTLFTLGILEAYRFGDLALATAQRMENLGVKTWAVIADQVRALHHSLRGESVEAKAYLERVELAAIQGAQSWQAEVVWPVLLLNADVLTGDAMSARRRFVQLERLSKLVPTLAPHAEAARAAYLMLRGDSAAAVALYEKLLPSLPVRKRVSWETTRAYFAAALNATGQHARAKAVAEEVVAGMLPEEHEYVAHFLEAERQLALAECGLRNHDRAAALLDDLLRKYGEEDQPLLIGLLHQARAEVAQQIGDRLTAERHRGRMEARFRRTKNPLLIAQCERSSRSSASMPAVSVPRERLQPVPATVSSLTDHTTTAAGPPLAGVPRIVELLGNTAEPVEAALELVMRQTKAKSAFLYVPDGAGLSLVWSSTNAEPPGASLCELERWVELARENDRDATTQTERSTLIVETVTISGYRLVVLRSASRKTIVGGIILEAEPKEITFASDLFEAVGRVVEEHGNDVLELVTT